MDPVTAYECRHKIKSGDACADPHASYRAWMLMCSPNSVHMVENAFGANNPTTRRFLEQWAHESGWPNHPSEWCAPPRPPLQVQLTWWQRRRGDIVGWALLALIGGLALWIVGTIIMGLCQLFGHC